MTAPSHTQISDLYSPFQTQLPRLDRTGARELLRQGSHKGTPWPLDPYFAVNPSAETWDDGVSTGMKGPLLILRSSDDGKRSRDRGAVWFSLQISKMKTNYPRDLKWWWQKTTAYFHPKLILSIVCCVKLDLMTGKAFKLSFSSPPFHVCGRGDAWKHNVIGPEHWRSCSELLLDPCEWVPIRHTSTVINPVPQSHLESRVLESESELCYTFNTFFIQERKLLVFKELPHF